MAPSSAIRPAGHHPPHSIPSSSATSSAARSTPVCPPLTIFTTPAPPPLLQPVPGGDQAFLGFAVDEGLDLDVGLQAAAGELLAEELVELEDAGGVRHLDAQAHRLLLAVLEVH